MDHQEVIAALARVQALRLAAAIGATLSGAPGTGDRAWAADAAASLEGLAGHVPGEAAAGAAAVAAALASGGDVAGPLAQLEARLAGGPDPPARIPLEAVAAAARDEAARAAARRRVVVGVDVTAPEGVRLTAASAGVLVDALGRVVRDAVAHGTPDGGALRLAFQPGGDDLTVVVSDGGDSRGDSAAAGVVEVDARRTAGLQGAAGRLAAAGGELAVGVGPWGGASVTLRLPGAVT
ncbi:MAG: hypothetical protein IT200_14525 [Thermoleophilia bacterium]|nr:hypothetical protein [Thermoleophilia bacterium]